MHKIPSLYLVMSHRKENNNNHVHNYLTHFPHTHTSTLHNQFRKKIHTHTKETREKWTTLQFDSRHHLLGESTSGVDALAPKRWGMRAAPLAFVYTFVCAAGDDYEPSWSSTVMVMMIVMMAPTENLRVRETEARDCRRAQFVCENCALESNNFRCELLFVVGILCCVFRNRIFYVCV